MTTPKTTKLFELLPVRADLKGQQEQRLKETLKGFANPQGLFYGQIRQYEPFRDEDSAEGGEDEQKSVTTTVHERLDYTMTSVAAHWNVMAAIDRTNQNARADLVVAGNVLAEGVPATTLLAWESELNKLRQALSQTPTLPTGYTWVADSDMGDHIVKRETPETKLRTQKTTAHKVLVEAQFPKEGEGGTSLPAQIDKWSETINIGRYTMQQWYGLPSSADKAKMMDRCDTLLCSVKQARQRANDVPVVELKAGKALTDFILGDI